MTQKLQELFNLPNIEKEVDTKEDTELVLTPERTQQIIDEVDKIDAALPMVRDLSTADEELDTIARDAKDAFSDLMDLGMNVEPRHSARLFEVAATMLKTSLDAKASKTDKKLKMLDLQLKKARLDQVDKKSGEVPEFIEGDVTQTFDRNDLLDRMQKRMREEKEEAKKKD